MKNGQTPEALSMFWFRPEDWREAVFTLDFLFRKYDEDMGPVRGAARQVREALEYLAPYFDRFSAAVCPSCDTPCCLVAKVAFDFKDLLYIRTLELPAPPHQLRRNDHEHCRYLAASGCLLPRHSRPFICTWYYCAPMLVQFGKQPPRLQRQLTDAMREAQEGRKHMEDAFVRVVCP